MRDANRTPVSEMSQLGLCTGFYYHLTAFLKLSVTECTVIQYCNKSILLRRRQPLITIVLLASFRLHLLHLHIFQLVRYSTTIQDTDLSRGPNKVCPPSPRADIRMR